MNSWRKILNRPILLTIDGRCHGHKSLAALCAERLESGNERDKDIFGALGALLNEQDQITLQTSGSTGKPKTISVEKDKMLASAMATINALELKSGATLAHCLSCAHVGGSMMLVRALALSAELIVLPLDSSPLNTLGSDKNINLIAMAPIQVVGTLHYKPLKEKFSKIKNVIVGGAPLDKRTTNELSSFSNSVYSTFGMTETLSHIALRRVSSETQDYFECLAPTTISSDEHDCLIVHAPHLSETDIKTNDVVEILEETRFRWLGRADNVVNSGGIKLHPEVLEEKIAMRMESRYFFTSKPDPMLGQALILMVEGAERTLQFDDLLEKFERPREVRFVARFNEVGNGKVNRQAL